MPAHRMLMPEKQKFLFVLCLLVLLLAACGGAGAAGGNQTNSAGAGEDNVDLQEWLNSRNNGGLTDLVAGEGEVAADVIPLPPATAAPANNLAGADGIPMGFTAEGRPYKGDLNAPVIIEEFSDYQCPYCARWAEQTFPSLLANQIAAGEVMLVYYDFPLNNIHPQAAAAANAARCAGEQDIAAYWQMHDILFGRVNEWSNNNANATFVRYGEEIELDIADFQECVQSNRYGQAVQADLELGNIRGVSSTPSFFLNEQILVGAHPTETFDQAITALLNGESIAAAQPQPQTQELLIPTPAAIPVTANAVAFTLGDPAAPVQIVEYTDYQCPYCRQYAMETMPRMLELIADGRVHYILKDLPLEQLHANARGAAKAARCAGDQDAYLEMHDLLFAGQTSWQNLNSNALEAAFVEMAAELELDAAAFAACTQDSQKDALIQANIDEAFSLEVNSTPTFFINGYMLRGAQPFEEFERVVIWGENGELEAQVEANYRAAYAQYLAQQAQQQEQPQQPPPPTGPVDVPTENAFAIGSPDAPVTIVEYTDYQCPFCSRHFTETYPQLLQQYVDTGIVRYVFKDFPLISIHPQAEMAAEAARCAGEQNAFLEMHDALFANQSEWNGRANAAALFAEYAVEIGLEPTPFNECLESRRHRDAVQADLNEGIALGVRGTPTFFINGYYLSGAQPMGQFVQAIEQLQNQP